MSIAIVTGASGYIGRNLVKELKKRHYYVIQCYHEKEPELIADKTIQIDLLDLHRSLAKIEHCLDSAPDRGERTKFFHLASVGSSITDYQYHGELGTFQKMTLMDVHAKQISDELLCDFVYASSIGAQSPRYGTVGEGYDLAKQAMDFTLRHLRGESQVVTLPSVVGPDMDIVKSRLIPNIVKGEFEKNEDYDPNKMHPICSIDTAVKMLLGDHEASTSIIHHDLGTIHSEVKKWTLDGAQRSTYDSLEDLISKTVIGIKRRL